MEKDPQMRQSGPTTTFLAFVIAALLTPTAADAKRKKPPVEEEQVVTPIPATFRVYGTFLQDQFDYEYGERVECDLYLYVVQGSEPVTDATVSVGDLALPADNWLPGRYRAIQQCVEPGAGLSVHITRENQVFDLERSMIGFPVLQTPAVEEVVSATSDLVVSWDAAEGATAYTVELEGLGKRWTTSETQLSIPKAEVPPYCHLKLVVTAYGANADVEAAIAPLSGAEKTWPGLTPVTRVRREFSFGPSLMNQNWAGQAVIHWWVSDNEYDDDLFKVWLRLTPDGQYVLHRVKIALFENGMLDGREIPWEVYDTGTFALGEGGNLELKSELTEDGWTANYTEPTLTLVQVFAPTDDAVLKKQRAHMKRKGFPEAWDLTIQEVEAVEF
jgi:hypothetical protein